MWIVVAIVVVFLLAWFCRSRKWWRRTENAVDVDVSPVGSEGNPTPQAFDVQGPLYRTAAMKAREFLAEANEARGSFVDNRQVEAWQDRYASSFAALDRFADRVQEPDLLRSMELFAELRSAVDGWNRDYVASESARCDALFGRLDARQRGEGVSGEVATPGAAGAGIGKPQQKGKRGEDLVAWQLRKDLPEEYRILNDIYLPLPDGTTTQIDHIVVSQYGVFVVETKTYSGWIFGDEKGKEWTQSLPHAKNRFQNPMRQNYKHICALADNLGIDKSYFIGVVAFAGDCTFKTEMPDGVVYSRRAAEYIRSHNTPMIKPSQIDELASAIAEWQGTLSEKQIDSHVANLQKRHSAVHEGDNPLCPYCGGEMVLRKRKGDGKSFYGCKSYPKCRGIINVE